MSPLDAEVALIVKAPNQQTEDVSVRAQSAWSIRQLKDHLSEVYPSKPKSEEQKIIYSGQLLTDSAILKDVLRVYEGQAAYTLHLVCTPSRFSAGPQMSTPAPRPQASDDGLRRRNVGGDAATGSPGEAPRPETRQNDQNHTAEMHNYYSYMMSNFGRVPPVYAAPPAAAAVPMGNAAAPMGAAMSYEQMILMQQAYMQYMHQYANMWRGAGGNFDATQLVNNANEAAAQPAPAAPQEPADEEAEGAAPRDWLDWLYAISRLAVLFSLLYFYSSPIRLAVVMLLAVAGYLYQLGFFREMGLDMRQNEQVQAQPRREPRQEAPRPAENGDNPTENGENPTENQQATPVETPPQQSVLGATWMIFTSFFTSLIPETPNVV